MSAKHLQIEFDLGLVAPLNLTEFTSLVLAGEKSRERLVDKKVKQKINPPDNKVFDPAGRYGPARNAIKDFYRIPHQDISVLKKKADELKDQARLKEGQAKVNCLINAEVLYHYVAYFPHLQFKLVQCRDILSIKVDLATVKVNPDLYLIHSRQLNLVKLRFIRGKPNKKQLGFIKKKLEIIYFAQLEIYKLPHTAIFCIDVSNGEIIYCPEPGPYARNELKKALKHYQQLYRESSRGSLPDQHPLYFPEAGVTSTGTAGQPLDLPFPLS